jgi:hypothetical protein
MIERTKSQKLLINKVQIHSVSVQLFIELLLKVNSNEKEELFKKLKVLIYDRLNILEYNITAVNLNALNDRKLPQKSYSLEFIESLKIYISEDYTDLLTYLYYMDALYNKVK